MGGAMLQEVLFLQQQHGRLRVEVTRIEALMRRLQEVAWPRRPPVKCQNEKTDLLEGLAQERLELERQTKSAEHEAARSKEELEALHRVLALHQKKMQLLEDLSALQHPSQSDVA